MKGDRHADRQKQRDIGVCVCVENKMLSLTLTNLLKLPSILAFHKVQC